MYYGGFDFKGSSKSNVDKYYACRNCTDSNRNYNRGLWNSLGWKGQIAVLVAAIVIWKLLGGN